MGPHLPGSVTMETTVSVTSWWTLTVMGGEICGDTVKTLVKLSAFQPPHAQIYILIPVLIDQM